MEVLTLTALSNLIGKTIFWKMPDGREGIMTIVSISENDINTLTISGVDFNSEFIDTAIYKSYGKFIKI